MCANDCWFIKAKRKARNMTSKAYVCAKVVNQDGKLVVVDARIYSSPSTSLTTIGGQEMYMQVCESSGLDADYDSAYRAAFQILKDLAFLTPYSIIFDLVSKNDSAQKKYMENSGFTFAKLELV
jgi:hypothetical protein